jgi:hypothetical protein
MEPARIEAVRRRAGARALRRPLVPSPAGPYTAMAMVLGEPSSVAWARPLRDGFGP